MLFSRILPLTRIDLYVLANVLRPMRNVFLFILVILECVRFRLGLNLAMHQDNFFALVFIYMGQWLALYAGLALQLALAIGVMLGFTRLAQTRELDALHALGFGLHRLMAPIAGLAVLVAVADFVILGWSQPLSLYRSGAFVHQVQRFVSLLPEGGDLFVSGEGKTILIDGIAPKSNSFNKIFIFQDYPDGKAVSTGGSKGHLVVVDDDPNQYYDISDARMLQVVVNKDGPVRILPEAYNASATTKMSGPVRAIDTSQYRPRGDSEFELTFDELVTGSPPNNRHASASGMTAELNYRIVQVLYVLIMPFLAVLFVIEPKRNPGPFRFLAGLLIILAFHQFMSLAVSFSRPGTVSVLFTLWLPITVLAVFVFTYFRWLATKPGFLTAR